MKRYRRRPSLPALRSQTAPAADPLGSAFAAGLGGAVGFGLCALAFALLALLGGALPV